LELKGAGSNVVVQALCPGFTYSEFHEALGVSREQMMRSSAFWMTAGAVVNASLQGLSKRKLFVVPGWRYQLIAGIITKLPYRARLAIEGLSGQFRQQQGNVTGTPPKQVSDR
jgi:hypothetical protein